MILGSVDNRVLNTTGEGESIKNNWPISRYIQIQIYTNVYKYIQIYTNIYKCK